MSFFWPFNKKQKDDGETLKTEIKHAFSAVKQDINKAAEWITHLNDKHAHHETKFEHMESRLATVESELEELKSFMNFFSSHVNRGFSKQVFKQRQTAVYKQTPVEGVQTAVQTGVQTAFLGNLSVMERAIVWVLANTNMKLSCEDIATILNKDKATIRGQINSIKQKSENLVVEFLEKNGKKRYYIEDSVKEMIVSNSTEKKKEKVRIKHRSRE